MARQSLYLIRRDAILEAIEKLSAAHGGRSPSLREISDLADVSVASLHAYLSKMRQEGLIEWEPKSHRSLKIVSMNPRLLPRRV